MIGLDIGSQYIKCVSLVKEFGKIHIAGIARKRAGIAEAKEIPAVLKGVASQISGLLYREPVVVGTSSREITLQVKVVHTKKGGEFHKMMAMEEKEAAEGESAKILDYLVLKKPNQYSPKFYVLQQSVSREFFDLCNGAISDLQINAVDFVPNPIALYSLFCNNYPEVKGTALLVNVGYYVTDVVIVRNGKMMFARCAAGGTKLIEDWLSNFGYERPKIDAALSALTQSEKAEDPSLQTQIEQVLKQFADSIKKMISYSLSQLDDQEVPFETIYLSGGGSKLSPLKAILSKSFDASVEFLDPFRGMKTAEIGKTAPETLALPSEYAVAAGLAILGLKRNVESVSLLSMNRSKKRLILRNAVTPALAALVLIVGLGSATIANNERASDLRTKAARIDEQIRKVQEENMHIAKAQQEYSENYLRAEAIASLTVPGDTLLDVISGLVQYVPKEIVILSVGCTSRNKVKHALLISKTGKVYAGTILKQTDDSVTLRTREGEQTLQTDECTSQVWEVDALSVSVEGEVSENVLGGYKQTLLALAENLTDRNRGIISKVVDERYERPGWWAFKIVVSRD